MKATSLSINLKRGCNAKCPFCISRTTVKPKSTKVSENGKPKTYNFDVQAVKKALKYARYHGVDTLLITSNGEPLLDDLESVRRVAELGECFPVVELQTNGFLLLDKPEGETVPIAVPYLTSVGGVTTIAISIAHPDPETNTSIMGLPEGYDYRDAVREVVRTGVLCRLTWNLHTYKEELGYRHDLDPYETYYYAQFSDRIRDTLKEFKKLGVHQVTLREIGIPTVQKETEASRRVVQWIKQYCLNRYHCDAILSILDSGPRLRPLPHGGWVHDVEGMGVVFASCMTETHSDEVRSLILQPDGHLYHSWNYAGSVLL